MPNYYQEHGRTEAERFINTVKANLDSQTHYLRELEMHAIGDENFGKAKLAEMKKQTALLQSIGSSINFLILLAIIALCLYIYNN